MVKPQTKEGMLLTRYIEETRQLLGSFEDRDDEGDFLIKKIYLFHNVLFSCLEFYFVPRVDFQETSATEAL